MTKFIGSVSVLMWIIAILLNLFIDVSNNAMISALGCLICGIWLLEGKE